ncbi:ASCH domain-containing protein [Sporomusa sp.]|uniref:ASCH domain-containing protein n=1 Tax=Sporomusa sp. TaxID=2078658 RepID=UPI002B94B459|nr:ASCH domain-containing protein [Sporomusa sp.]HWR07118.1 ASCH domain-containing protein [Sporomusa sp.]
MKAITILQPFASLIACGAKQIETRSWPTKYRGPIAIHAGVSKKYYGIEHKEPFFSVLEDQITTIADVGGPVEAEWDEVGVDLPYGAVIAIADLVDCLQVSATFNDTEPFAATLENLRSVNGNEFMFGDYTPGRYAWMLANVRRIEPVPAKGMQRIWEWEGQQP